MARAANPIGIIMTARCNAACRHCSDSCGPRRTDTLREADIIQLMREWSALPDSGRPMFLFSGGEPFLDLALLERLLLESSRLGAFATCVTNGYWARSVEYAEEVLSRLKSAGLTTFAVSSSVFHEEFVSRQRVARVLNASRNVGLSCGVKLTRVGSDPTELASFTKWAKEQGAVRIEDLQLLPFMRTGEAMPDVSAERVKLLPEGRCPASLVTVKQDRQIHMCCTPGADNDALMLGTLGETPIAQVCQKYSVGGLPRLLRWHGPAHVAKELIAAGYGEHLRERFTGVCDLCTHLTTTPQLREPLRLIADAGEVQTLLDVVNRALDSEHLSNWPEPAT